MYLSPEQKQAIIDEFLEFKEEMYAGKSKEERQELDQFFTPADLTIQVIEECPATTFEHKVILDPTSGSGNLLAAALIIGADSDKIYGNDYDAGMVKVCRDRLNKVCKKLGKKLIEPWQIHRGNALDGFCLKEFGPDYKQKLAKHFHDLNPLALMYDPDYQDLETWLSKEQIEFLKEVE